jgi:uncharacterized membrane protein
MPKTSAELKAQAKEQLKGRWGQMVVTTLVFYAVTVVACIIAIIPILGWIGFFVVFAALTLGFMSYTLKFAEFKNQDTSEIFSGFKRWADSFVLLLLVEIFTFLWSLLLVIPGIIKSISYSMAYFVLAENPNMKASEALEWSKRITEGHKGRIFYVYLSFIGWSILASFTMGIGYLWLVPYMSVTFANLYNDIKELNPEYKAIVAGYVEDTSIYETNHN